MSGNYEGSALSDGSSTLMWDPVKIGELTLPNRLVVAPMSRVSTNGDGVPTSEMTEYYVSYAEGGFGLIISEGIYPYGLASQAYENQPGLASSAQVLAWTRVVESVHRHGGVIFAQLMHAGALSQHLESTVAPSVVAPRGRKMPEYGGEGPYPVPTELDARGIAEVIDGFARSAVAAREAGFDGVEVHAANGYLLDQFVTAYTNQRTDRYGGNSASRARFVAEVISAIKSVTHGSIVVGVRLSQAKVNDSHYRWDSASEAAGLFGTIGGASPDYIHLAGEGRPWTQSGEAADGTRLGPLARSILERPVIVNGGLGTPELVDQILTSGEADLVSLGKAALADPKWPHKVRNGLPVREFDNAMISPSASIRNTSKYLART